MSNDAVTFSARFGGIARDIYVPVYSIIGIYAKENGQGLFFDPNEYSDIHPEIDKAAVPQAEEKSETEDKSRD